MKNYAIDEIDERDFFVEELLGSIDGLPSEKILKDDEIQNQKYTDPYGCVFFAGSSVSNTMNYIDHDSTRISGHELCKRAIAKKYLNPGVGAKVSNSPKLLQEEGYIKTYCRARSLEDIKTALCNNKPVQTGSKKIDWEKTIANDNVVVEGTSYGHSFFICGYSDIKKVLICENSYGEGMFKGGYFFIKYSDINLLFNSQYIMTDVPRKDYDETILEGIEFDSAKDAYKNGFWNGKDQNQFVKRGEAAAMMQRVYEKGLKK